MSLLSGYLTAHRVFSVGFTLPFALWYVFLQNRKKEKGIRFISGCLVLVSGIADLVFHHPVIFTVFRASAFLTGFLEGVKKLYDTRGVWKKVFPSEHAKYVLRIVKCIIFTLVFIFLAVIDIYPDLLFRGQTGFNKTTYPAPEELNWEGYALRTNLQYGDTYPNSIFDLMTCEKPEGTVIWNEPSLFATTPLLWFPFSKTEAPMTGNPVTSRITPRTVIRPCWASTSDSFA